jgi:outer membrane protein assembly factor BamB
MNFMRWIVRPRTAAFRFMLRIRKAVWRRVPTTSLLFWLGLISFGSASGQVQVLTQHNDTLRTGANLSETRLNTTNVTPTTFRKLYSLRVDGNIYAQPLYVPGVSVHGRTYNVLYVATEHNTVYAFDADVRSEVPLWQLSLGPSVAMPNKDIGINARPGAVESLGFNLVPESGITSTPVIDPRTNTLFVVAFTNERNNYRYRLHALDITNGQEKASGPIEIHGSVAGVGGGTGCDNSAINFNPPQQLQRPALLLDGGFLYIAFGSQNDAGVFHGWVFAYDAANLQRQPAIFNTTPNCPETEANSKGGIWQAGQGLVADRQGNVYFLAGDSEPPPANSVSGNSFIRLTRLPPASGNGIGTLAVRDWFRPSNQKELQDPDNDLGSAGPLMLPETSWLLGGGKAGMLYLVNSTNMGGYRDPDNVLQVLHATQPPEGKTGHIHGSPVYWNSPVGKLIYVWGENDPLRAFKLETAPAVAGQYLTPLLHSSSPIIKGMPGGILSVSANGNTAGTGIVWATHPLRDSASDANVQGVLYAYDAATLRELWKSADEGRNTVGLFAKFCPVTVANGKVYVPTFSGQLHVYGLDADYSQPTTAPAPPAPSVTPLPADITTKGDWSAHPGGATTMRYGNDGYYVVGDSAAYPSHAQVNPMVPRVKILARTPESDVQPSALFIAGSNSHRITASWGSDLQEAFLIDVDIAQGISYRVSLYVWDKAGNRSERIEVLDLNGRVISGQDVSGPAFGNGEYLSWNITGHVQIRIKKVTGDDAIVNGLFFDQLSSLPLRRH